MAQEFQEEEAGWKNLFLIMKNYPELNMSFQVEMLVKCMKMNLQQVHRGGVSGIVETKIL